MPQEILTKRVENLRSRRNVYALIAVALIALSAYLGTETVKDYSNSQQLHEIHQMYSSRLGATMAEWQAVPDPEEASEEEIFQRGLSVYLRQLYQFVIATYEIQYEQLDDFYSESRVNQLRSMADYYQSLLYSHYLVDGETPTTLEVLEQRYEDFKDDLSYFSSLTRGHAAEQHLETVTTTFFLMVLLMAAAMAVGLSYKEEKKRDVYFKAKNSDEDTQGMPELRLDGDGEIIETSKYPAENYPPKTLSGGEL